MKNLYKVKIKTEILSNYLKNHVSQDVKKKLAVRFVYIEPDNEVEYVKGNFILSNYGILRDWIPENLKQKFSKSY